MSPRRITTVPPSRRGATPAPAKARPALAPVASPEPDALMSPAQLAEFLGLTLAAVRGLHRRRCAPPHFRLGDRVLRYRRSEVLEWLEAQREQSGRG